MAQPYVGEIRMFAGNFAPAGWQFCDGTLLPISEFETLFNLIGTTYGGDGQSTFAVPDLRGRIPLHFGGGFTLAETGGVEQVTLTVQQIPSHTHALTANTATGNQQPPTGQLFAQTAPIQMYIQDTPDADMSTQMIASTGGNQPHENFQPYLCVSFIISLYGIFPSQT